MNQIFTENTYKPEDGHQGINKILNECFNEAYNSNVVIKDYGQMVVDGSLSERDLSRPTKERTDTLTDKQILAAIAWKK